MTSTASTFPRAIENDTNMQSAFRRLLSAIEAEQELIRSTWQTIEQEQQGTTAELERLRQDTEEWCQSERMKIGTEWKRLDKLSERMASLWDEAPELVVIFCSGKEFTLLRSTLCSIEGSALSQMFSRQNISQIGRDSQGRLLLDFNPECFTILIEYLHNRRLRPDAPVPVIPSRLKGSMDKFAELLRLKPFLAENKVSQVHSTSLWVDSERNSIQASHPGWQVISTTHPLPETGASYVEIAIEHNPNSKGGLAIGVCGHVPQGNEVHSISLPDSILYNSCNGILGDCIDGHDVIKELSLEGGSVIGMRNDMGSHRVIWYYKSKDMATVQKIGSTIIRKDSIERMRSLYPVFALYVPDQRVRVNFNAPCPEDVEGTRSLTDA